MTQDQQICAADLGLTNGGGESRNVEEMSLEEVEAFLIKKALARNDGNARKAAEALGLEQKCVLPSPAAIWSLRDVANCRAALAVNFFDFAALQL